MGEIWSPNPDSDILLRLRATRPSKLTTDAANEIERLRTDLADHDAASEREQRLREALEAAVTDLIGWLGYAERQGWAGTAASIQRTLGTIDAALSETGPAGPGRGAGSEGER